MREHLPSDRPIALQTQPDQIDTWLLSSDLEQHLQQQSESQFLVIAIVLVLFIAAVAGAAVWLLH